MSHCSVAQPYVVVVNPVMPPIAAKDEATHDFGVHASSTTIVTTFGGIEYYLAQAAAQVITLQPSRPLIGLFSGKGDLFPCTVINSSKNQLNRQDLEALSAKFALHDDVWTHAFLESETSCRRENAT